MMDKMGPSFHCDLVWIAVKLWMPSAECVKVQALIKTNFTLQQTSKVLQKYSAVGVSLTPRHGCDNLYRGVSRVAGLVYHRIRAPRWHNNSCLYLTQWTPRFPMFSSIWNKLPGESWEKQTEVICNYTEWIQPPTSFHCPHTLRDNEMEASKRFFLFTINPASLVLFMVLKLDFDSVQ